MTGTEREADLSRVFGEAAGVGSSRVLWLPAQRGTQMGCLAVMAGWPLKRWLGLALVMLHLVTLGK